MVFRYIGKVFNSSISQPRADVIQFWDKILKAEIQGFRFLVYTTFYLNPNHSYSQET